MKKTCLVRRAGAVGLVLAVAAPVPASAQDEGGRRLTGVAVPASAQDESGRRLTDGAVAAPVPAQDEGGRRLTGVVSQSVVAGTNLGFSPGNEGLGARSQTAIDLGFLSETRTQSFAVDAGISVRTPVLGDDADESEWRILPSIAVTYGIEGPRTALELQTTYRLTAVDEDTSSQAFELSGRLTRQMTPGLSVNTRLGFRVDGAENDGVVDTTESTFVLLGADYEAKRWQFGAEAGVRIFEDEIRPAGRISVARDLPDGSVSGFLGVSSSRNAELGLIGGLQVDYALNSTNRLNGSLSQSIAVSDEGEDQLRTRAELLYVRDLTNRSDAALGVSFSLRNELGDFGGDNLPGAGLTVGYNYELTERADLNLGYEYRFEEEATGPSSQSHLISVGITLPFDL